MSTVITTALVGGVAAGGLTGVAAAADVVSNDKAGLYAAIATAIGSAIGGIVAIYTARRNVPESSVRYVDPPTSNELPRALSELLEDALNDARRARDETQELREQLASCKMSERTWERRARDLGWRES